MINWNPGASFHVLISTSKTSPLFLVPNLYIFVNSIFLYKILVKEIRSKVNKDVRLLEHDKGMVKEDHLDN